MKPEFRDQTKNNNNTEHWPITTQYFDHVIARFCREIEHCSIRLQNLVPEKFGTRLYDRRARNRRQFSGAGFWRRFLERVSLAQRTRKKRKISTAKSVHITTFRISNYLRSSQFSVTWSQHSRMASTVTQYLENKFSSKDIDEMVYWLTLG